MLSLATLLDKAELEQKKEGRLPKFFYDLIIELIHVIKTEHHKTCRSISFTKLVQTP